MLNPSERGKVDKRWYSLAQVVIKEAILAWAGRVLKAQRQIK